MRGFLKGLLNAVTSLKLTLICLSAATILVFAGTLAQVSLGIHEVQVRYFQSLLVWWSPPGSESFRIPIFVGGHLLGAVLLVNLIAAHIRRFRWTWSKAGIQLTHGGLIVMLAGGLATDLFSVESHLRFSEGETINYSEDGRRMELAIIDQSDPAYDQVTSIPHERLQHGGTVTHESLPFQIAVQRFYRNSRLRNAPAPEPAPGQATPQGIGARVSVDAVPPATGTDQRNVMSALIEIQPLPGQGSDTLGTWLVSDSLAGLQEFSADGRTWAISLRPRRYYMPASMTLEQFTHERYPGTEIPKNFSSRLRLVDPETSTDREVLISMNHPLRYRGDTFYQSGFSEVGKLSILQVVRNPGFLAPYAGCIIVGAGLLLQFSFHLVKFARRRRSAPSA